MDIEICIRNEHGVKISQYWITKLLKRKQPCLYKYIDGKTKPLAYFVSAAAAEEFGEFLSLLISLQSPY